jgi:hypothetical protein
MKSLAAGPADASWKKKVALVHVQRHLCGWIPVSCGLGEASYGAP